MLDEKNFAGLHIPSAPSPQPPDQVALDTPCLGAQLLPSHYRKPPLTEYPGRPRGVVRGRAGCVASRMGCGLRRRHGGGMGLQTTRLRYIPPFSSRTGHQILRCTIHAISAKFGALVCFFFFKMFCSKFQSLGTKCFWPENKNAIDVGNLGIPHSKRPT